MSKGKAMFEDYITAVQIAKHFNLSYDSILGLVHVGKIRGYKVGAPLGRNGGRWKFKLSEVEEDFKRNCSYGFDKHG